MKILKTVLLLAIAFAVILLIAGLFIKKNYVVEKEIVINKPIKEVFDYIKYLKNQDIYSVWQTKDPNMKKSFIGTDGKIGFVSAWNSELSEIGKGEQEIMSITEGERLDFELRFVKPLTVKEEAYMTTEYISDNKTKVKWGFRVKMAYPKNIMLLVINMDELLDKNLETSLVNLKNQLEK
ncbi:MAG: SRPBCC family protein [Bacteroidia bacterium]|nr:SRPBCC family protein [Bacteroidia bacterium]